MLIAGSSYKRGQSRVGQTRASYEARKSASHGTDSAQKPVLASSQNPLSAFSEDPILELMIPGQSAVQGQTNLSIIDLAPLLFITMRRTKAYLERRC